MMPEDQFLSAIEAAGLTPPATIHADGGLHRFSATGKRHDDAGWYVLYLDGVPAGRFGNWRTGEVQSWCAKANNELSDAERAAMRERIKAAQRMRDAETARRQADTATSALAIWEAATPAAGHPYLTSKAVAAHGIRTDGHYLFIPMRDHTGKLHSLQSIGPDGEKRFMPGGKVKGSYHAIGRPTGRLTVCEGYATGATIFEATGEAVAVAFNAGNLQAVAVALRAKYPALPITLAADDDWKTEGNPGLTVARKAAYLVGGKVAVPDFTGLQRGPRDTDFNDLFRLHGETGQPA